MSISFYQTPASMPDEEARSRSVEELRAWKQQDDPVLAELARSLRRRFGSGLSAVSVVGGDAQYVLAADGSIAPGLFERRKSFCGHAVAMGQEPFCVPDLSADPRFAGNPWVSGDADALRFYAAALVRDAEGLVIGAVCVADPRPRAALDADEEAVLLRAGRAASDRLRALSPASADVRRERPSAGAAAGPTSPAPPP